MQVAATAMWMLEQEARALLTRLARVKPFALQFPQVVAAAVSPQAQEAIERHLARGRRELRRLVLSYLRWLRGSAAGAISPTMAQRRFTVLRIRFNTALAQFDIFADVLAQRSQHEFGIWISGLDAVAADALALPGCYEPPPVVCYLDRGHGAAIRRARTRLPGGGENPVAVVRVPRERMVGSGIASSLVHEVGHQGSALLDLVNSLRPVLQGMQRKGGEEQPAWVLWERWISEILADFWSLARVGVAATMGLIGVVSLPRPFVFRIQLDDPHPFPWIRVKLSCAMGQALFPHRQWEALSRMWEAFYPTDGLDAERQTNHRVATGKYARLRRDTDPSPAKSASRQVAGGSARSRRTPAIAPVRPLPGLAPIARPHACGAALARFCGHRPGPRRWADHARGGEPCPRRLAQSLGADQHLRFCPSAGRFAAALGFAAEPLLVC